MLDKSLKINKYKKILVNILQIINLLDVSYTFRNFFWNKSYICSVNYHCTPVEFLRQFEDQLNYFRSCYSDVTEKDLEVFLNGGGWNKRKPGLILTFDDGLRSNYDVAAPLLEKYGFRGWFMVPPGFIEAGDKDQKVFAKNNNINCESEYSTRIAMSWVELENLSLKGHHICSHTLNHVRLPATMDEEVAKLEINQSKDVLEAHLKSSVRCFAWVGGEEENYSPFASKAIKKSGYYFSFNSNGGVITNKTNRFCLGRINIEVNYPLDLVKFQLSSIADLRYKFKRRRTNKILREK